MYNSKFRPQRTNSPSFSDRPSNSRGSYSNSGFSRSSRPSGGRSQRNVKTPHYTKYIQKATPVTMEEYKASFQYPDLDLHSLLKESILARGYSQPTPIQDQAIPVISDGKDLIGLADTGTGKTAAFLIPLLNQALIARDNKQKWQSLIIAPTRELALQIESELWKLTSKNMNIFSTTCIGGTNIFRQIQSLKRSNQFIIGTPGRIKDLIDRRALDLQFTDHLVLDEVDRMLDMGFIDDIKVILSKLPTKRQTLFFSATLGDDVRPLAAQFLNQPVKISLQKIGASQNVHQDIVKVGSQHTKMEALEEILKKAEFEKALIFTQTKVGSENLQHALLRIGYQAESIHGDKNLSNRRRALDKFKRGDVNILVATDVAARGIDVVGITHVINYDEPDNFETYTHRVGRTGRSGQIGWAFTFVNM